MTGSSLGVKNTVVAVVAVGLGAATAVGALGFPSASSAKVKPTTIKVIAGKPSEFHFKLSKVASIKPGVVVFKVTNKGAIPHTFKICRKKSANDKANTCVGKVTKLLKKGASATVTVKLGKGSYEFLCTVPGHAAAGMKGLLGVGMKPALASTAPKTTIRVLAGKPSEFHFKLSKVASIKPGVVVFKVTNKGAIPHTFKICRKKSANDKANTCVGKVTKLLKKGASATVTVKLGKGSYEFLCTVPGHAAAGMKGLIGVGLKLTEPTTSPTPTSPTPTNPTPTNPTPTSPTPTTPTTTGPEPLQGDPVAGKAVFLKNGCSSCHTLAAAGANGNIGPNLDLAKPTQELVRFYVTNGGGAGGAVMPPFTLSATDLNNLAAFVYQSTHGG
jgi:uncharacterized cupredoxin-like copper-binding protein/cytochrome c551/c552